MSNRKSVDFECCDGYRASSVYDMIVHIIELDAKGVFEVYPELAKMQAEEREEYLRKHSINGTE